MRRPDLVVTFSFSHHGLVPVVPPYFTVIDPSISRASAHRLSKGSSSWGISTNRTNHQEEMRRVRLQQQQALDRLAQQAAARKKEEPPEPVPKPKKKKTPVRPLSNSSNSSGGYNPMQPWTSSAGGGYKYVLVAVAVSIHIFLECVGMAHPISHTFPIYYSQSTTTHRATWMRSLVLSAVGPQGASYEKCCGSQTVHLAKNE